MSAHKNESSLEDTPDFRMRITMRHGKVSPIRDDDAMGEDKQQNKTGIPGRT